ncbi:magnesium transporter [Evansella cellulosilytica]|uniref:MgtE integral membrane region n=1 Tax=Evansella cellulosilytica (strain ATCC 21833 / DSM 2522 / FERM P-1141 / JCM 9156 / N-4) TaxID=649639 RepID=E6TQW5_EVAC2|nr:magnesium transporter [Evansella cellulosilytica]ADU31740.1 MgtE integral membrane region [Evansella cellulosilytica DSM 2522]
MARLESDLKVKELENYQDKEVLKSDVLVNGSIFQIWKVRLPFLIITLIGGMLAGAVVGAFEEALEAIVILAIFIPVIMDMGGNAGTQSSSIFTRAFVLGQITFDTWKKHLVKEIKVGLSMGAALGVAACAIATMWQGIFELGVVVGLSLFFTVTIATTLGFLIPYILLKLGFDQAAGSDPFITTIKDVTGLLIYFGLASVLLAHLM